MTVKKMITYRPVWMGLAILWIMFFHSDMSLPFPLIYLLMIGYGGVDIFMFASGIGNYYSYLKDEKPLDFFKRRILRLAPEYIPVILIWCIYSVMCSGLSIWAVIGNLFGVQTLSASGSSFNWFITGIIICYLLTPYLAVLIRNNSAFKNVLLILGVILVSLCFMTDERMLVLMSRLPVYVIGMVFAKYENSNIRKKAPILIGGFVIGNVLLFLSVIRATEYLWSYGLYWYPFILITPGLCWIISEISSLFDKCFLSKLVSVFKFLGGFTFELFLVHWLVFSIIGEQIYVMPYPNLVRAVILVLSIAVAFAFNLVVKKIGKTNQDSSKNATRT